MQILLYFFCLLIILENTSDLSAYRIHEEGIAVTKLKIWINSTLILQFIISFIDMFQFHEINVPVLGLGF